MKSPRSSRLGWLSLLRALLGLCVIGFAHLFASAGCSSGAVCYRHTDCPNDSDCTQGQCVRRIKSEASVAGSSSTDNGAAGETDASQTPDAN